MNLAASNLLISSWMATFFSAEKFLFFCFTGLTSLLTFSLWTMTLGSIPGISSAEKANMSACSLSRPMRFTLRDRSTSVPIRTVRSVNPSSNSISSVSSVDVGSNRPSSRCSKFSMLNNLSFLRSALFLFRDWGSSSSASGGGLGGCFSAVW